jgi:hypothetical protein
MNRAKQTTLIQKTTWIPICCVCHQVRDDRQSNECTTQNVFDTWMSLRSFLCLYHIARGTYQLTHTYCLRCMEQLGLDRPNPRKRRRRQRAETFHEEIRRKIVDAIDPASECDLDTLVSRCGGFSRNQVFLELNHLSRIGIVRLTKSADSRYHVGAPTPAEEDRPQIFSERLAG